MTPRGRTLLPAAVLLAALVAAPGCASRGDRDGGKGGQAAAAEIGVNSLLWRASLDTLSFMPLALTDSSGGVILTDWYADPKTPNERFKLQVYVLDTRLRADAVKVNVFKQVQGAGGWTDAAVSDDTGIQIENQILTAARQLRLSELEGPTKKKRR